MTTFTRHQPGQQIKSTDVNELQVAVETLTNPPLTTAPAAADTLLGQRASDGTTQQLPPLALTRTLTGLFVVDAYGTAGATTAGAVTDDSAVINAACAAAHAAGGGVVVLTKPFYGIGAALSGSYQNIVLRGLAPNGVTLIKQNVVSGSFMSGDYGVYRNWTFENVNFDGNVTNITLGGLSFNFYNARHLRFTNCTFRGLNYVVTGPAARDVHFVDCTFYGTRPGIMQAGAQDPAVDTTYAAFSRGIGITDGNDNWLVESCVFHFCDQGINQNCTGAQTAIGLTVRGCTFRADWWNNPYVHLRFTPSTYNTGTRVLTAPAGTFTGHFGNGGHDEVLSIPVAVTSGTGVTTIYTTRFDLVGAFGAVRIGDVIETADGKRAEVTGVTSADSLQIARWEAVDTFEPTTEPASTVAWRITRYYGSLATYVSDTQINVYSDPVNVFTGETISLAGINLTTIVCRAILRANYTGIQINANQQRLVVTGNTFRGGWADQCSMFNSTGPIVANNHFEYGQDEGITCTGCNRAVLSGNNFKNCGVSAIYFSADNVSIVGNTVYNWGLTNRSIRGAIEGSSKSGVIVGNTGTYDSTTNYGGQSNYLLGFYGAMDGSRVGPNSGSGRLGDILVDTGATGNFYTLGQPTVLGLQAALALSAGGVDATKSYSFVGLTLTAAAALGGGAVISQVSAVGNIPLVAKGMPGQTGHLQEWQDNNAAILAYVSSGGAGKFTGDFNQSNQGLIVQQRPGFSGGLIYTVRDQNANVVYGVFDNGTVQSTSPPATSGAVNQNSPTMFFGSSRWDAALNAGAGAAVAENFTQQAIRLDAGQYRLTYKFSGPDNVAGLVLGSGGMVAVGESFPGLASLTRGQFHSKALADTTPAIVGKRASATTSADIYKALDESDNVLWRVNKAGYPIISRNAAPADADLAAGDLALWLDTTNGAAKLMIKAKEAGGAVRTAAVALA